ncbi:methyltransferase [Terrimonas sp.]|uniref:methyltransferase domain-containing protein n=1 Tax=Terrimonas sp. TaxID=1914338 RepID=UPI000D5159B4|nr:methyltransferase domain-containing protein [Terrimonas sp.]PVD53884.1 methyltransferase [Terrimonas sp.]
MLYTYKKESPDIWFTSDTRFNGLYPEYIQTLARRHWTPLNIAKMAAGFLAADDNVSVLDIGSGVGKFCLGAAYFKPNAMFYGVEQRKNLIQYAESAANILGLDNVDFIHGNFTQLSFKDFDHFYFYNSFYENLVDTDKIDDSIDYSGELYHYYSRYLCRQLSDTVSGTRLCTYHSMEDEIPSDFCEVGGALNGLLKFWIKP